MARLIDEIRAARRLPFGLPAPLEAHVNDLFDMLADRALPVLAIDNVAAWSFLDPDKNTWRVERDFPNLAPPYPRFWTEYRHPKTGEVGCLVQAREVELTSPQARWILLVDVFCMTEEKRALPNPQTQKIWVDAAGAATRIDSLIWDFPGRGDPQRDVLGFLVPTFLAICFLHCKNVSVAENRAPQPQAKKWHAKHNLWPAPYKTLVIEPLKEILRRVGRADQTGLKLALHQCRGHFKDYREGRGLFGKHYGEYFWAARVRGTKRYDEDECQPPREIQIKPPRKGWRK